MATLATAAPDLAAERAGATPLFRAVVDLQVHVAAWASRLAHERADSAAAVGSAQLTHVPSPPTRAAGRPTQQTSGEPIDGHAFFPWFTAVELEASATRARSATSMTSSDPASAAAACVPSSLGHADQGRTPTPPAWLHAEVEAFFRDRLAAAIQTRESQLVNVMRDCLSQELRDQQREFDKWRDHLQSSLDRRVAETNALRKDFYKQLLMLRDLVAKQRNDPRTLRALEDAIATAVLAKGEQPTPSVGKAAWSFVHQKKTAPEASEPAKDSHSGNASARREKEKWEHRAREAVAECQQLQEQVLQLRHQLEEARSLDGELWFASAQHGLYERQRILDSVYKSKCTWGQVGDSIVELLNNEMLWEAVENSASRDKSRVSRGLEALLVRSASLSGSADDPGLPDGDDHGPLSDAAKRTAARRQGSTFLEGSRVIMCRTCNGCGYLDGSAAQTDNQEDDSYLRKTLGQVLELKAALEEANGRTNQVEQQLLRTVMEGAQAKETLEKIQTARANSVDSSLQMG